MTEVNMFKIKKSAIIFFVSAMLLSSCGSGDEISEFTKIPRSETPTETTAASPVSAPPETAAPVTDAPEATTAETAATVPREPVKLKSSVLEDHRFTTSDFPKQVYSNKKLKTAFEKIDEICDDYGYRISFVYKNMDTGASCAYNQYSSYGICSTIKAPFCKNLLDQGIDLDEEVRINVIWDYDGGTVARSGYGSSYTARELIRLAITESDNSAYYNLVNKYGFYSFNQQNNKLGANYWLGYGYIFTYCTAADLMVQYEDIYKYAEKTKRGEWLTKLMQKTDVKTQITAQLADKYKVSHKYGSDWDQNCYHDCAICYAESPFVLVIMTEQVPETEQSDKVFKRLAKQFDIVNEQLCTDLE